MIIAFNKPYGVISQFTPEQPGQRTLSEFGFPKSVYPIGRLDLDSEGLLLLSDEEGLNHTLLNPKFSHKRTYLVQVEGNPAPETLEKLCDGTLRIRGHLCLPCKAVIPNPQPNIVDRNPPIRVRKSIPDTWIEISMTEGKNRQVRRMTAAIGHPTLRLIRTAIGDYRPHDLPPGSWQVADKNIRDMIGL